MNISIFIVYLTCCITDTAKKFSMTLSSKQSKNASNSGNVKKENKTDLIFSRNIARRNSNEDVSPPRRRDKDISPPRKFRRAEDVSPPRKSRRDEDISPPRKSQRDRNISPTRKYPRDEDVSPPRKSRRDEDISPPRKLCRGEDSSSPKRKEKGFSPQGQRNEKRSSSSRKRSPLKNEDTPSRQKKKSRWSETASPEPKRMTKTLDGKTAGLQNAKDLAIETEKFKERENNLFENMSAEQSGINATTVVRDRKTGKVRDLEREQEEKKKKQEEEDKNKEKYSKWGRGLKQVEDIKEKITQDLHEMNKPLARYADDEDLERYLKEQERDDDPMLAYIRKKKRKEAVVSGKPMKPTYEGEFMPNRYGIRPGYRWDGVDRSNGYEKKWFEVQNAKTAQQEEVYKWSTEDM